MTRGSGHDVTEIRVSAAWTDRRNKKHRVGGPRNDDRQAAKGTASPLSARSRAPAKTAVEMTSCGNHTTVSTGTWKSRPEREIPTFPQPIPCGGRKRQREPITLKMCAADPPGHQTDG